MRLAIILALMLNALPAHAQPPCRGQAGVASWYGPESGHRTASGAYFNGTSMTAASWWFPFGTKVRVTDLHTGRQIVVTINDRGPAKRLHRVLDLSKAAARALGMNDLARVCVERIG